MKFKKINVAFVTLVITAGVAASQDGPGQEWEDQTGMTSLFEFDGTDISSTDQLVFQMIVDPSGNTDFADMIGAGNQGTGWGIGGETHMWSGSAADWGADDDVAIGPVHHWESLAQFGMEGGYLPPVQTFVNADGTEYWNTPFYFRWFNSDDISTASEAGVIYNPNWRTAADPLIPAPAVALTYGLGDNAGSEITGEGWQSMPMVPEPGTFALFAIGLLTVAARRRKSSKSA